MREGVGLFLSLLMLCMRTMSYDISHLCLVSAQLVDFDGIGC